MLFYTEADAKVQEMVGKLLKHALLEFLKNIENFSNI